MDQSLLRLAVHIKYFASKVTGFLLDYSAGDIRSLPMGPVEHVTIGF